MQLMEKAKISFQQRFNQKPSWSILSPGRVNLIGEHTDYNGGFVFPFAINRYLAISAGPSNGQSTLISLDFQEEIQFDVNNLPAPRKGHWSNYLIGVMAEFQKLGFSLKPLNLVFTGNIPQGGGLSSSAALENAVSLLCNHTCKSNLSREKCALISQAAEHNYAGVNCGIMDQFISMLGQKNKGLVLDCRSLAYESIPLDIDPYCFILCNSNVNHELSSSEYNTRRKECEAALAVLQSYFPTMKDLRDCLLEELQSKKAELGQKEYQRALHQVQENMRVHAAARALKAKDLKQVGELMLASHHSLDELYEVSCKELNTLVSLASQHPGCLGARMTGGGFGGNTINLVHRDSISSFSEFVQKEYQQQCGIACSIMDCVPVEGCIFTEEQSISDNF